MEEGRGGDVVDARDCPSTDLGCIRRRYTSWFTIHTWLDSIHEQEISVTVIVYLERVDCRNNLYPEQQPRDP